MKEKLQKILKRGDGVKFNQDTPEFKLIFNVLLLHPKKAEKIGSGVSYFFIQKSKWKYNQFNFMIKRTDDSEVDFSFYKCLAQNTKRNWNSIFRKIVKNQIDSFRQSAFDKIGKGAKFTCSQTKLNFKKIYAHVDHVYPLTFDSILNEFIETYKINLDDLKLSEDIGTSEGVEILNEDVIRNFSIFHEKKAVLRVVCNTANLQAKKTKSYNGKNPEQLKERLIKKYPQYHIDEEKQTAQN